MRTDLPKQVWRHVYSSNLVVVSFFTAGFYMREAWGLMRSCQQLDLDYHIAQLEDKGDWSTTTNQKPEFLLDMDFLYPNHSLLWLDADARIYRHPALFFLPFHRAVWYRTNELGAMAGTIFLPPGRNRRVLLDKWIEELAADPLGQGPETHPTLAAIGCPEQVALPRAVAKLGWTHQELPAAYSWIYPLALDQQGHPFDYSFPLPIIEHTQASRWAKALHRCP